MTNWKTTPTYNQYTIRKISENKYGNIYGMTIPREIAEEFLKIKFTIEVSGNCIVVKSGQDIAQLEEEERIKWIHQYQK